MNLQEDTVSAFIFLSLFLISVMHIDLKIIHVLFANALSVNHKYMF